MQIDIILKSIVILFIGYLLGSANASLIIGRFYGVDVRKHGSGNAGATNTLRTLGKKAAIMVGVLDVLKGIIACIIGLIVIGDVPDIGKVGLMVGGLGAILGHNWPVFFGFKGGKGVFTSFAVLLMMDWKIGLMMFGVFLIVVIFTKYISLGSVMAAALFPVVAMVPYFGKSREFISFASLMGLLVVFRHRANIQRIFNGTESKFGRKKEVNT